MYDMQQMSYISPYIYTYIYNEAHSAIKKNEILPFVTTYIDLETIMLGEISQTERQIPYNFTYTCNLKN